MARELEGKIFIVHHERNIPTVAFVSPVESSRVEREMANVGLHLITKEIFCFGPTSQRIFVLLEHNLGSGPILAFTNGKDAHCMRKVLRETGDSYAVTEISCFSIMREQVLAKYKLKYMRSSGNSNTVASCYNCDTAAQLVRRFKD
jgi:hypothetical protein